MAEITPANPVEFDQSKTKAQLATGLRDLGLVVAFVPALLGLIGKHDIIGAMAFMQTEQGLTALSLIAGSGLFVWRQIIARRKVAVTVAAVESDPQNPSVVLKGSPDA